MALSSYLAVIYLLQMPLLYAYLTLDWIASLDMFDTPTPSQPGLSHLPPRLLCLLVVGDFLSKDERLHDGKQTKP